MSQASSVVTRFAPSPTGFLHIGGARTALYNWLFARHHGGSFVLRIEDTDKARSTQEAVDAIIDGMQWLGLDWDGDAVSQASRADRHAEVAARLLAAGHAYHCFATPEENQAAREAARADGRAFLGDLWRDRDASEAPEGRDPVVRLKMPREGKTVIEDAVQGSVTVANDQLDDLVILRSDGSPTYMLSVVVDDHDMGITHVIRGDDHLNNAFKQVQIYQAMGWDLPVFAHIPLIHGADGKKLSKRHGATGVDGYRDMGYLADAVNNYLLRLGWSHGDEEIISRAQATEWFALDAINKGAARFDFDKLDSLNSHYLRAADADVLLGALLPLIKDTLGTDVDASSQGRIKAALPMLTERAKRIPDMVEGASLYCNMVPLTMAPKSAAKLTDEVKALIVDITVTLKTLSDWSAETLKAALVGLAEEKQLKLGAVMQPVRLAVTLGRPAGDLMATLEILGRDLSIARLDDCAGA